MYISAPYTEEQWQKINELGYRVEEQLQRLGVGLTMGGEPTFVSVEDFESPQWRVAALGEEKRYLGGKLLKGLAQRFSPGGELLHYGSGKLYPEETFPRWALGCYWRSDGVALWRNSALMAEDGKDYGVTHQEAKSFILTLVKHLGVNPQFILTAYETETGQIAGYTLPLLAVFREGESYWSSCTWDLLEDKLYLLPGDSAMGLRLPLNSIPWGSFLESEAILPIDSKPTQISPLPLESPKNSICIALSVEVRQESLYLFIPPLASPRSYIDLITAIEDTSAEMGFPVFIEGYPPPSNAGIEDLRKNPFSELDYVVSERENGFLSPGVSPINLSPRMEGFQITPDPGVIEINIHPAADWEELVKINTIVWEEAIQCRLGTEKYLLDGRRISTGGGAHITLGGKTVQDSPLLRRPDLLRSLITYFQHHPSLSYLFSGLFVGPSSQSPRIDEARHEGLYELEIAFQSLPPYKEVTPSVVDCLLRNLLIDVTGNTHRTAFCIDKLFPVENPRQRLGLLELRSFAMPPHLSLLLLQLLLIRAFVSWFWESPYTHPLIRWGTMLHDRFMLPHFLREDLNLILSDLQSAGYPFELDWFEPFFDFRFPLYGEVIREGLHLELRGAIEPWLVLGESLSSGGTSHPVDDSLERIQVILRGAVGNSPNLDSVSSRYVVTCNGYPIPLKSTGVTGEYVAGVRFRARQYLGLSHPSLNPHTPLHFEIVERWNRRSLGGCIYHAHHPEGKWYDRFPADRQEADLRMKERFIPWEPTPGMIEIPPLQLNNEYPLTLDLRTIPPNPDKGRFFA